MKKNYICTFDFDLETEDRMLAAFTVTGLLRALARGSVGHEGLERMSGTVCMISSDENEPAIISEFSLRPPTADQGSAIITNDTIH